MAWTAPLTAVSGAALTAVQWNASVRDNLLETAAAKATVSGGYIATAGPNQIVERRARTDTVLVLETTTSTTYTDLPTFGPSVTVETGTDALVITHASVRNTANSGSARMAHETSGDTSINAADNRGLGSIGAAGVGGTYSAVTLHTDGLLPLTPGTNTFTAKYRVSSGTGEFTSRRIIVLPY
ncbi:hypothetical protein ACF07Q_28560 [Nocardiopsis dassonvillei]|uniref:hypothetical protein n=1 Tax=Nocardiopsis dassonvillei TaxID=2014 RepID=UPI003701188D